MEIKINEECFEYEGQKYDVGTRVRNKDFSKFEGTVTSCDGRQIIIVYDVGFGRIYGKYSLVGRKCFEIIKPVYYEEKPKNIPTQVQRNCPPSWDVEVGWIWYVVIMFVLLFFKARWLGWIAATIIFFGWKNGSLNGGNK